MPEDEVGAPERQLDDLDHELSRGLRHEVRSQATAVPSTRPPSPIRLVVLEFAGQEDGNEDFMDGALDGNDGDKAQDRVRYVPEFEEPLHKT